jgi:hypothetical protein
MHAKDEGNLFDSSSAAGTLEMKEEEGKKNLFMGGHTNALGPPSSTVNECFGCTSRGCISDGNMKRSRRERKGGLAFH